MNERDAPVAASGQVVLPYLPRRIAVIARIGSRVPGQVDEADLNRPAAARTAPEFVVFLSAFESSVAAKQPFAQRVRKYFLAGGKASIHKDGHRIAGPVQKVRVERVGEHMPDIEQMLFFRGDHRNARDAHELLVYGK